MEVLEPRLQLRVETVEERGLDAFNAASAQQSEATRDGSRLQFALDVRGRSHAGDETFRDPLEEALDPVNIERVEVRSRFNEGRIGGGSVQTLLVKERYELPEGVNPKVPAFKKRSQLQRLVHFSFPSSSSSSCQRRCNSSCWVYYRVIKELSGFDRDISDGKASKSLE